VQGNWKSLLGGCITVALAFAGVYLSGLYGKVTLKYTRWTQHNDFRDGCITDRDHNLTLAEECFAELARPRVSAVNVKRHLEAVQDACVNNAFYWTVAICIPVLTCLFYLVWMRAYTRDGPRPVVSLVKVDLSNCGQGHRGNGSSTMTQIDGDLYDLSDIRDEKFYDHQQQAAMDATPSDPGSDQDYFQAWKDRMKSPREDSQAEEPDTESTHPSLPPRPDSPIPERSFRSVRDILPDANSPIGSDSSTEEFFEAEFEPSMNRAECQHILCDGSVSEFQPTDGILLEVWRNTEYKQESILKLPFERGATALELRQMLPPNAAIDWLLNAAIDSWPLKFPKRATWARRLGLSSHRFVYIVVRDVPDPKLSRSARRLSDIPETSSGSASASR
jgi:hypothetical protein